MARKKPKTLPQLHMEVANNYKNLKAAYEGMLKNKSPRACGAYLRIKADREAKTRQLRQMFRLVKG